MPHCFTFHIKAPPPVIHLKLSRGGQGRRTRPVRRGIIERCTFSPDCHGTEWQPCQEWLEVKKGRIWIWIQVARCVAVAGVCTQWWEDSGWLFILLVISSNTLSLSQALIVVQGRAIDPNSVEINIHNHRSCNILHRGKMCDKAGQRSYKSCFPTSVKITEVIWPYHAEKTCTSGGFSTLSAFSSFSLFYA